jgi:hypothetical protein
MSMSSSDRRLRSAFSLVLGGLVVAAAAFFALQNSGLLPGGQVAPVKLAWLACAILFWYLLPCLLLFDRRLSRATRVAVTILLANMLARAVVELFMMYVSKNWHPRLGIGHDLFSLVLMSVVTVPVIRESGSLYASYLLVATAMFVPEALFAWYMLTNASVPGETVYFVPNDPVHNGIMFVTAGCVVALAVFLVSFAKRWLYGQTASKL